MTNYRLDDDTICAVSTPPGLGGISVIRVSGPQAAAVARKLCAFLPLSPESHHIYFGTLKDPTTSEAVDEVLLSYFAEGRSYTGEETVEVSCHGGRSISAKVLELLISSGARLARNGEFTYRAFMNGRIDLVQAESVLSLIESRSQRSARMAMRHLKGEFSETLGRLEDRMIWVLAHLEANIDFAQEDIEAMSPTTLLSATEELEKEVAGLLASYRSGRWLEEGLRVVLIGCPNVGKSSLLNALVREDRAIVTDIPGTTRDTIVVHTMLSGIEVSFVDTAGLRETTDVVERLGIKKSWQAIEEADLVLLILDGSRPLELSDFCGIKNRDERLLVLVNKIDTESSWLDLKRPLKDQVLSQWEFVQDKKEWDLSELPAERFFAVSAKTGSGLANFESWLQQFVDSQCVDQTSVLTQPRHYELLGRVDRSLKKAAELMREDQSAEFIALELQDGLRALHELLGKEFDDQVMDRVFKEFCLGK